MKRCLKYFAMFTKTDSYNRGFTLVELLIVISIMAILASGLVMIVNPLGQLAKSRDARRKSDLHQMELALEQYYNDNGKYPYRCETAGVNSTNTQPWLPDLVPYIKTIPVDPINAWGNGARGSTTTSFVYIYESKNIG